MECRGKWYLSQIFTNLVKISCKWKFELIFFSGTCLWVTVYFKKCKCCRSDSAITNKYKGHI